MGKERRSFHFLDRKAQVSPTAQPGIVLLASTWGTGRGRKDPGLRVRQQSVPAWPSIHADLGVAPSPPLGLGLLSDKDLEIKTSLAIFLSFLMLQVAVLLSGAPWSSAVEKLMYK